MPDSPRILYVDDDPDQLRMLSLSLRDEYDVDTAEGGTAGLKMLRDHGPYAAVVADMRMPRMNGAQMLAVVRDISPHTVRILLTGDADLASAMAAVNQAYVFRYLTKPCPRDQLREVLRAAVQEHTRDRARDGIGHRLGAVGEHDAAAAANDAEQPDAHDSHGGIALGMVIGGRYRLEEALAVGATATVFRCHDWVLEQEVAIKIFPGGADDAAQRQVKHELLIARQLSHPRIVRTHDVGVHDGYPFITMELLSGYDLASIIAARQLSLQQAVDCLTQACEGLQHVHSMGITHRDVRPENLFLSDDGQVHVMDFGYARSPQPPGADQPARTTLTPPDPERDYTAPEQRANFSAAGPAADIYALGCVGYALLTGEAPGPSGPVHGSSDPAQAAPAASEVRPGVPPALDALLQRAMAETPAARFASCAEMADALRALSDALPSKVA